MKLNLSIFTGVASLAALMSGVFADTATTDPVGYVTVDLAGGTPSAPGVSVVGPTLVNPVSFAGVVTATPGANQLQFAASSFTSGAFNGSAPNYKYWVELTNGAVTVAGMWTDIVSNNTDTITTVDNLNSLITVGVTTVKIRAHQTIASFLGATNAAGLVAGPEAASADTILLIDPVTQNQTVVFFSNDPDAPGWLDSVGNDHSNDVIAPGQGVLIRHRADSGSSKKFTVVGHVKTGQTVVAAEQGNNLIVPPLSTGVTVGNSGLTPVITAGPELNAADNVILYQAGLSKSIFLNNDPDAPGWQNSVGTDFTNTLITETSGFLLRNLVPASPASAYNITFPAQVIAP